MKWILVLVILHTSAGEVTAEAAVVSRHETMAECFKAFEGYRRYVVRTGQLICKEIEL